MLTSLASELARDSVRRRRRRRLGGPSVIVMSDYSSFSFSYFCDYFLVDERVQTKGV